MKFKDCIGKRIYRTTALRGDNSYKGREDSVLLLGSMGGPSTAHAYQQPITTPYIHTFSEEWDDDNWEILEEPKTEEVTLFVKKEVAERILTCRASSQEMQFHWAASDCLGRLPVKVTINLEFPKDKKVTLTESEVDEMIKTVLAAGSLDSATRLKAELFK